MLTIPTAQRAFAVTPSDTGVLPNGGALALWVGVAGTLSFVPADPSLPLGTAPAVSTSVGVGLFPVGVAQVHATGTTATSVLALY